MKSEITLTRQDNCDVTARMRICPQCGEGHGTKLKDDKLWCSVCKQITWTITTTVQ